MEDRELKIHPLCRNIDAYIMFNGYRDLDGNSNQQGENLERVNTFKYLGATYAYNGDTGAGMPHQIHSGWETVRGYRGLCVIG